MNKLNPFIVAAAATLLASASAFAAPLQPAAGQAPYFNGVPAAASAVQRQDVRAAAARQQPAAGETNALATPDAGSALTRAQVQGAMRDAVADGFHIATGECA